MSEGTRRNAVVAIIQKSNKFLLVKRSDYIETAKGYWCPVSGGIEKNETQEETISCEVMEEVGLEVIAVKRICGIPSHNNTSFLNYWTTKIISGKARVNSNEATDIKWVTIEEMKQLEPHFEEDIEILKALSNTEL